MAQIFSLTPNTPAARIRASVAQKMGTAAEQPVSPTSDTAAAGYSQLINSLTLGVAMIERISQLHPEMLLPYREAMFFNTCSLMRTLNKLDETIQPKGPAA